MSNPSVAAGKEAAAAPNIVERMQSEIERAFQRTLKGFDYMASPGPAVGVTPKDEIHRQGTLRLYHYHPLTDDVYRIPVLLVMATTNRAFIFDLTPGQSLIEFMLKRGFDVYVMDWEAPRPDESNLRMDNYVDDFIPDCVRRVQRDSGVEDISILGYCMGGVLSTTYAALNPDGPLKNLVCFTTPIDFSKMDLFTRWSDKRHFDVDRMIDTLGNMPPELLIEAFSALRPGDRVFNPVRTYDNMWNDEYIASYRRFDKWSNDMLPLAGEYFRQTTKELMWENALNNGTLKIRGKTVDLKNIKVPLLHIVAEHDHIVPYAAARALLEKVSSTDKEEVILKGGHVSIVAGPNAVKRAWPKLTDWLAVRSV